MKDLAAVEEAVGQGVKIIEAEVTFLSSSCQFPKPLNGLHCPGRFAISLFFIVLYDHIEGYTEHVDLHGPTFSLCVDIAFLYPVILTQCTHSYAHFRSSHACCRFDFSGVCLAHACQKGDQHGYVSWHIQASQCFDEFQILFVQHFDRSLLYYNPSRFIHKLVAYKYFL